MLVKGAPRKQNKMQFFGTWILNIWDIDHNASSALIQCATGDREKMPLVAHAMDALTNFWFNLPRMGPMDFEVHPGSDDYTRFLIR